MSSSSYCLLIVTHSNHPEKLFERVDDNDIFFILCKQTTQNTQKHNESVSKNSLRRQTRGFVWRTHTH